MTWKLPFDYMANFRKYIGMTIRTEPLFGASYSSVINCESRLHSTLAMLRLTAKISQPLSQPRQHSLFALSAVQHNFQFDISNSSHLIRIPERIREENQGSYWTETRRRLLPYSFYTAFAKKH